MDVEAGKVQLRDLQPRIEEARRALDQLYDERRRTFRALLDNGVTQREVARCAGVTPMAVALAIRSTEPKKESRNGSRANR